MEGGDSAMDSGASWDADWVKVSQPIQRMKAGKLNFSKEAKPCCQESTHDLFMRFQAIPHTSSVASTQKQHDCNPDCNGKAYQPSH